MALATLVSLVAGAQPTNHTVRSLSLKECLDLALANNLSLQIERYSPQISRYLLKASYGAYDPTLDLSAKRSFVDEPAQFNPKKYPLPPSLKNNNRQNSEYEATYDTAGPDLRGRLPSGLTYDLFARSERISAKTFATPEDINLANLNSLPPLLPQLTNDYYATAGIVLRQPLLKDFWIDAYRRNIQIEKKNLHISELVLKEQIMTVVTKVTTAYYDLTFASGQVNVESNALELANVLADDTLKKVRAGTETDLELQQAESQRETVRTGLFAAEQNLIQRENVLKNLLTDDYQSWSQTLILPSDGLSPTNMADLPPNRNVSWLNALNKRPELLQMQLDLEKQDILLRFTYNQLFPSLDLVGSYGWQAVERGFGASITDIRDGSNPYYSVGVVVTIPLGNIAARNNHRASQEAKKQAVAKFRKLQQDIFAEVDTAVKLVETTAKEVSSTTKARRFAESALDALNRQLLAGTMTVYRVMEGQRNLTRARAAENRALADYYIALAQLALSEGTTLEKNQVNLKVK